jgi:hypothetical protein
MKTSDLFTFRGPDTTPNGKVTEAARRHAIAKTTDTGAGCAIRVMLTGWGLYAEAHLKSYESAIGDDGVLGDEWAAIGKGILGLLNGERGGFDGGSLNANIREFMRHHGASDE